MVRTNNEELNLYIWYTDITDSLYSVKAKTEDESLILLKNYVKSSLEEAKQRYKNRYIYLNERQNSTGPEYKHLYDKDIRRSLEFAKETDEYILDDFDFRLVQTIDLSQIIMEVNDLQCF